MKKNISKEQMNQCLNCRIGYTTIYNFKDLYEIVRAKQAIESYRQKITKTKLEKDLQELKTKLEESEEKYKDLVFEFTESIDELAESLEIEGDIEKKLEILGLLCSNEVSDETDNFCVFNLHEIIYPLRHLYMENAKNEDITERPSGKIAILRCMNEINKTCHSKYNSADTSEALKLFLKKESTDASTEAVANGIRKIWNFYLLNPPTYKIHNKSECFQQLFDTLRKKDSEHISNTSKANNYFDRKKKLNSEYQIIIDNYIATAPKHMGNNLTRIMQLQNMSEQDIAKLTDLKANKIQSMMRSKTTELNETELTLICRALLISKSLLFTGTGEVYGNWKDILELKNENIENVNEMFNQSFKTKTEVTNYLRKNIHELIDVSEDTFNKTITENPQLFNIETLHLYDNEMEEYEHLLHPEEAETLLAVCEKLN